ncbi:hypothetical protein ACIOEX_11040 [Streptomyces sp. NPDC087850]|uniref:hypothetical protein n=1 Tax=Streptomyces sp. NPDC087850 TaxID=3365809 RepID=UPI0038134909
MDECAISTTVSDDVEFLGGPYGGTTQTLAARPGAPDELPDYLFWWADGEDRAQIRAGRTDEEVAAIRPHYRISAGRTAEGRPLYVWRAPHTA